MTAPLHLADVGIVILSRSDHLETKFGRELYRQAEKL